MKKTELISQLFNKRWNYAWGNPNNFVVGLFYSQGGFKGLLELLKDRKKSMLDYKNYYSEDLISTLEQLISLGATEEDFEYYINLKLNYNKLNFQKLK